MCACGREEGGWLCGIRTIARGRGGVASGEDGSPLPWEGALGGAVNAARASRCRVTELSPTRMCLWISGGGGGVSGGSLLAVLLSFCASRFRFFPLEGVTWVLRWSPRGCSRLW